MTQQTHRMHERDIGPENESVLQSLGDIWSHRELIYFLAWRDVKVRYKQTVLGVLWALFRPAVSAAVFTFVFSRMAQLPSGGVPYILVALAGVLGWGLVSDAASGAGQSMLANTGLVTKVYFPRIILPLAALCRGIVDSAIAAILYLAVALWLDRLPGVELLLLPLAFIYALVVAFAISLWFSAAGVRYRDVAHALPFVLQGLFWISPVGYSAAGIPASMQLLYWLNPVVGVVELFRFALLGEAFIPAELATVSVVCAILLLAGGLFYFRRVEASFADVI